MNMIVFAQLLVEDEGPVRIIALNRPDVRNAIDVKVVAELSEAIAAASSSPSVRVVILTGVGDKAFAAGGDIHRMATASPAEAETISRAVKMLHDAIRRCAKPVIAAVNGACLGGGLELAMACDIRIAARSAIFGLPEIRLGIIPGGGGTMRLSRLISNAAARAMCLTGQIIDAKRAYALGLVSEVSEPAKLMAAAKRIAFDLAGLSSFALGQIKSTLDKAIECDIETGEALEAKAFALCFANPDQREGMTAFLEKRKPKFS